MEIKTTHEIWSAHFHNDAFPEEDITCKRKWVAVDEEVREALTLYHHLKNHTEVKNATQYRGMPCCKICKKSSYQIMCEEWLKLLQSTQSNENKKEE